MLRKLASSDQVIEIGPFSRPTVFAHEAEVYYADYYTTAELHDQATQLNIPVDQVPEVFYVLKSTDLKYQVSENEFDFIIANHVLEHVIDPFRWLKDLEFALKPNGRFLITLPDKRFSFDKFRTDTSLPHFIEDFLEGGDRTISQHSLEAALYYDNGYQKKENDVTQRLQNDFLVRNRHTYHPGMHVHVFQAENFLNSVLIPFLSIGWFNLELDAFELNAELGEFYISLVKKDAPVNLPPDSFFQVAIDTLPVRNVSYKSH